MELRPIGFAPRSRVTYPVLGLATAGRPEQAHHQVGDRLRQPEVPFAHPLGGAAAAAAGSIVRVSGSMSTKTGVARS